MVDLLVVRRHTTKLAVWAVCAALAVASCTDRRPTREIAAREQGSARVPDAAAAQGDELPARAADKGPPPAPRPPKRIFAKRFVVPVREGPDKKSYRVGYLRAGSVLMATTAEPVGRERCRRGWYELAGGGFVCSGRDVIAFYGDRLPERRATQPDLEAKLPYPYGYSMRGHTPVYRRLPTDDEAALHEGYGKGAAAPEGPQQPTGSAVGPSGAALEAAGEEAEAVGQAERGEQPLRLAGAPGSASQSGEQRSADAGPPTLGSLLGERDGVVQRQMVKGFYVSLDREMRRGRRRYWRTQANGFIAHKRLRLVEGTEFHGVHLGEQRSLPVGYVLSSKTSAYTRTDRGWLRRAGKPGYHYVFRIVGEEDIRGGAFYVSDDGRYFRARQVTRIEARTRPPGVGEDDQWVDVDLGLQTLVAYRGDRPVFATLISSGRVKKRGDPLGDFETPAGEFRLLSKHLTHTMDGDHAVDGPYSIEDVPYVMYFQLAYALHSAFWHNAFGRPRSHGCINMAPLDAKWLFNWLSPPLPQGWHAVYPTEKEPATRLFIRGQTPVG